MALFRFFAVFAVCIVAFGTPALADDAQDINRRFRSGDLTGALEQAERHLAKNPKDAQVRFLKGLILGDQGKRDEAIRVFTSLTEDFPELPEPYNNLAVLYAAQEKYDAAKHALDMAIRVHPNYATAHENLGDLYAKLATLAYDKALALDTGNTAVQTKRARIGDVIADVGSPAPAADEAASTTGARTTGTSTTGTRPADSSDGAVAAIEAAIADWAKAWSKQDVAGYFAAYASNFSPAGLSRAQWEAQRRSRITAPRSIDVQISDLEIERQGDTARANFRQSYRSDRLSTTVSKALALTRVDGRWRIVDEISR
ncbi:nuclear transport factor 2 family protein [Thiobacillus denitrificans]|nr:nuclear transport factor 2 family protein [Thiobacillus denitrificans]